MLEAQNTLMSIINARRSGSRPRTPRSGMSYSRQRRSEKSELLAPHFGNRLARATVSYLISGRSTFVCPMDRCGSQSPADLCTMACTLTILSTYHLLHVLDQAGASICNSDRHAFRRVLPCESLKRGSICTSFCHLYLTTFATYPWNQHLLRPQLPPERGFAAIRGGRRLLLPQDKQFGTR